MIFHGMLFFKWTRSFNIPSAKPFPGAVIAVDSLNLQARCASNAEKVTRTTRTFLTQKTQKIRKVICNAGSAIRRSPYYSTIQEYILHEECGTTKITYSKPLQKRMTMKPKHQCVMTVCTQMANVRRQDLAFVTITSIEDVQRFADNACRIYVQRAMK